MNDYIKKFDFKDKLIALASGEIKCIDNVNYFLSNIKKDNEKYNICLEINKNISKDAKILDLKREKNAKLGSLFGLTFLFKSNISIKNLSISCASNTLKHYKGSFDADIVKKIRKEDGLILGIVNNDEFASGVSGQTSVFGKTINPKASKRVPGGSSAGSAAAISANFCDISFGSDTGGSIRNPASNCGVIGIKPSYGRVSRHGLIDLSMSLDQIGPLSKEVLASAKVMEIISGWSQNDATTIKLPILEYSKYNKNKKFTVGIIKSLNKFISDKRILELFEKNIEEFKKKGCKIIELDIKNIDLGMQAYYPIVYSEFFSGTRRFDGLKYGEIIENSAGKEVLRRILGGKEISRSEYDGAYYKKALKIKDILAEEFTKIFSKVDCIFLPSIPKLPHKFEDILSPIELYFYDIFTIPASLAGICAGVVSKDVIKEKDENIPIGFQIYADKFREDLLFLGLFSLEKFQKFIL